MRLSRVAAVVVSTVAIALVGCRGGCDGLIRQYEYEEQIYVDLDGSATVIVNASVPALVALRGLKLSLDPRARFDRNDVRRQFQSPVAQVARVSRPWRRNGRRYVQVRLQVPDIRRLRAAPVFAGSHYELARDNDKFIYRQSAGSLVSSFVEDVGWTGRELVAFRAHLPSRITFHNLPRGQGVDRGNILTWEQRLSDRLRGKPLDMEARMDTQSILYRTLWVFGLAFLTAVATIGSLVWWVVRRG